MKNILYIHGHASSAWGGKTVNCLAQFTPYNIFSYDMPVEPIKAYELIEKKIKEDNIDLIVATSLGAFYGMCFNNVKKLLVNPCLKPSIEIPKISPIGKECYYFSLRNDQKRAFTITNEIVEDYKKLEEIVNDNLNNQTFKNNSYFIFGLNDEFFSYLNEIEQYIDKSHIKTCESSHRLSNNDIDNCLFPFLDEILG